MQFAGTDEGISNDALLVLDVPGEQDEHVLDVGRWQIPYPIVALDLVGVWEEDIHSRYDEGLAPELPDRRDLCGKAWDDASPFHLSQDQGVGVILTELELKGQE